MTTIVIALFVLSIVILTSIMGGVIFLLRKYSSSRGDYYTQVSIQIFSKSSTLIKMIVPLIRRMKEISLQRTQTPLSSGRRLGAR